MESRRNRHPIRWQQLFSFVAASVVIAAVGCGPDMTVKQPAPGFAKQQGKAWQQLVDQQNIPEQIESEDLQVLSWNVESDGNDPDVIAKQLAEFSSYDIVALQEVRPDSCDKYVRALGESRRGINSKSGRSDRLLIVFDSSRLKLIESIEIDEYDGHRLNDGNHRSPLIAIFEDQTTSKHFAFVTVHLARGNKTLRTEQAIGLTEWARKSSLPVVAAGDFNFDYDFNKKNGNEGFKAFMRDGIWTWVKPDPLVDTNWSDRNGKDNYPDSMLDFVFVAGAAKEWKAVCDVIVRDGDFPDDKSTSDHRPVELVLSEEDHIESK